MRAITVDVDACRRSLLQRQQQRREQQEQHCRQIKETVVTAARTIFPRYAAVTKAWLFGSAALPLPIQRPGDVDIAVEGHLSAKEYFSLWRDLEQAVVGHEVDLVELGPEMRFSERVRTEGQVIYERADSDLEG